ncbi:MAG: Phosphoribosylformylglycinamidine synthase subunit PurL [Phycisphaerae bacterium]|nr:Phosphoribosylformylglycinamidine synthase subunit PurL [Phycisphaerae bacterium]
MNVYRIAVGPRAARHEPHDASLIAELQEAGLSGITGGWRSRLYFLEGELTRADAERIAAALLADPVTETFGVIGMGESPPAIAAAAEFEIHPRPGVMDPVALSTLAELRSADFPVSAVRTGRHFAVRGAVDMAAVLGVVRRCLANDCIEEVISGAMPVGPAPAPPMFEFRLRTIPLRDVDDAGLERLSHEGHLFLSLSELRAIQSHYRGLGRDPTDLELETLAQTWSEHCVHKTLKSEIVYRGEAMPERSDEAKGGSQQGRGRGSARPGDPVEIRYENLLRDTIARATRELIAAGRGPECLSVFVDNAGVIGFDEQYGIAFKVETHNHPSAIEPYGGAATGIGGCIRDVLGCGLGARPIASTDVFCVAPRDWPADGLPAGVLHPRRVLRGVVRGVADYGNRMGIPTVNGAIHFDPRYLGNPLVFCGCVGLIPRDRLDKEVRPGDRVVLIGGRTGRDGIHGATFSSAELTDSHADEFSHAVQIGNAITQKRFLDALLVARDHPTGCLYRALTDCGAGGLSSAVGEMAAEVGAVVDLEHVPLKYAGLRYDEIWISEAQERMVLAVPPERLPALLDVMRAEEVEASVIGEFGDGRGGASDVLRVRYRGTVVGDLDVRFLHHGLPRSARTARWNPPPQATQAGDAPRSAAGPHEPAAAELVRRLGAATVASKEWVIRRYDHEVQGGSVIKPLSGAGVGPNDAAVLRPRLDSQRGVALGCGLCPQLSDVDPYWMAAAAIDEAVRNVVAVGGDPAQTALLDNFCWGRTDDEQHLGALVRACQACYDLAKAYGTPFISGKDSLNNEFALDGADVPPLLETIQRYARGGAFVLELAGQPRFDAGAQIAANVRRGGRLSIPPTLLISAAALVADVRRCVSADLKRAGGELWLVEGFSPLGFEPAAAARVHAAVGSAIRDGLVLACHDASDGGWPVAAAEMAIGGDLGIELRAEADFGLRVASYLIEPAAADGLRTHFATAGVAARPVGRVLGERVVIVGGERIALDDLRRAWRG